MEDPQNKTRIQVTHSSGMPQDFSTQVMYNESYGNAPHSSNFAPGATYPAHPTITTQAPVYVAEPTGSSTRLSNRKNQSNAMFAGTMICVAGGMQMAYGLQIPVFGQQLHFTISWFIAVVIGSIISPILMKVLSKKNIYYISILLILIEGIIYTACRENMKAVFAGRYMDGVAFGLSVIPLIVSGGEIAIKSVRGYVASAEFVGIATGMFLQSMFTYLFYDDLLHLIYLPMRPYFGHGVLLIVLMVITSIGNGAWTYDTPVDLILQDKEHEALEVVKKMQGLKQATNETYRVLDDLKSFVAEDYNSGQSDIPLVKLLLPLRLINVLNFCLPLNQLALLASIAQLNVFWLMIFGGARMVASVVASYLIDPVGRKPIGIISSTGAALAALVLGIIVNQAMVTITKFQGVCVALTFYQLFVGIGTGPVSSVYLTEAFSIRTKPYFICAIVVLENLLQIAICGVLKNTIADFSVFNYVLTAFHLCLAGMLFTFPETKGLSLRECRERFKSNKLI